MLSAAPLGAAAKYLSTAWHGFAAGESVATA
jgi:hypothetical protein